MWDSEQVRGWLGPLSLKAAYAHQLVRHGVCVCVHTNSYLGAQWPMQRLTLPWMYD